MKYKLQKGTVRITGMEFFAYHGVQPEEQITGNRYVVDIEVQANVKKAALDDDLSGTVDYGVLYRISEEVMKMPAKLLEHLAYRIAQKSLQQIKAIVEIQVTVRKMNPPVGGVCKESSASLTLTR
jgi:dihydroneopterin aldolase